MNNIKRSAFWFWGFIILLVLNISATTTMMIISHQIHNNVDNTRFGKRSYHQRYAKSNVRNRKNVKAWKDLDFTKEQRMFLASEKKKHIEEMRILKGQLKVTQSKMFDLLANEDTNSSDLKDLKKQFIEIHQAILDENIHFYEQLKSKLSDEQMQAVKAHIERQFSHEGNIPKFSKRPRRPLPPPPTVPPRP